MFTDRYIQLPIRLYDREHKELTGKELSEPSFIKANPFEITRYRPDWDDQFPDEQGVMVYFRDGDTLYVPMSISDFETLLNQVK